MSLPAYAGPVRSCGLLEYTRPQASFRRLLTQVWEPWVRWAYGASFDRDVARNVPAAGLKLEDVRFVVDEHDSVTWWRVHDR